MLSLESTINTDEEGKPCKKCNYPKGCSRHPLGKTMQIKHEWKELFPFNGIGGELSIEIMTSHGQTMQTKYGWEKFFLLKGKIRSLYSSHQPVF